MNPLQWLDTWSAASQQRARRNAMIASTALAQRRAETNEVEDFLADVQAGGLADAHSARQVAAHG